MTISLKHQFQSVLPDGPDSSQVQPSNWNAEHTITLDSGKLVGRSTAGTGAAEEISIGSGLSLSAGTLSATGGGGSASWGGITGTLSSQTDLQAALDAKAAATHTHSIADVTGLETALDGKQAAGSYAAATHTHAISDVTGLQAALDAKLDDSQASTFGLSLLDDADATAARTTLGLGTLATQSGTFSGTSSGTNTGDQNLFSTIAVSGQSNVVADSTSDTLTLVAGTNVTITTDAAADSVTISATGGRELLTANRTYFVRTDGNDANNGLSNTSGGAFRNIQKAVDVVAALDIGNFNVTIQVNAGTYTEEVVLKTILGAGLVSIIGDETTPANVAIQSTGNLATDVCFLADGIDGRYRVSGFAMSGSATGNRLVAVNGTGTRLILGNNAYGLAGNSHINVTNGAFVFCDSNFSITGTADYPINILNAAIDFGNRTITITGSPAWRTAFILVSRVAYARAAGCVFSGTATGTRYVVEANGVIFTAGGGASFLPGNVAGSAATGGQYL